MSSLANVDATLPIFLNRDANNPANQRTVVVIFSCLGAFFLLFFLYQFVVNPWRMGKDRWQKAQLEGDEIVRTLRNNFWLILTQLVTFTIDKREIALSKGQVLLPYLFLAIVFVSFVLIQHAIASKKTIPAWWGDTAVPIISTTQAQAGFIMFFIGCNGYLVLRIIDYYRVKTELRKKIAARSYVAPHVNVQSTSDDNESRALPPRVRLNRDSQLIMAETARVDSTAVRSVTPPPWNRAEPSAANDIAQEARISNEVENNTSEITLEERSTSLESNEKTSEDDNFNDEFQYIRRMKHILPQYNKILMTPMNFVQILILMAEFVQLASFPYRDLLRNEDFQKSLYQPFNGQMDSLGSSIISSVQGFFNIVSAGIPNSSLSTKDITNIQFVVSWWFALLSFFFAGFFVLATFLLDREILFATSPKLKKMAYRIISGTWILVFLPLCNLFYLIILGAFVDPLGCISSSYAPLWPPNPASTQEQATINRAAAVVDRENRCKAVLRFPEPNLWLPISGYIMCYYVFTIFKTAEDPRPQEGIISFTTRSEVLNKNASLTILLLYTLIPTAESSTARGVMAMLVLAFMIFFQIRIGSSYVRPINFWRTISFIFVLWMSMCVVYFTHPSQHSFYGTEYFDVRNYRPWVRISLTIILGWVVILVLYTILYFLVIIKLEKQSSVPREGIKYAETQVDEELKWTQKISAKPLALAISKVQETVATVGRRLTPKKQNSGTPQSAPSTIDRPSAESSGRQGTPGDVSWPLSPDMEPAPSPAQLPFSPASTVGQERQEKTPQAERKRLHGPRSTPLPPSDLMSPPPATFNTMRTVSSSISQESSASSSAVGTLKSQTSFDSRNTSSPGPNRRSQLMGPRPLGAAKPAISGVFNGSTLPKTESTELVPSVEPSMDVPPTPPTRRSRLATNTETEQLRTMLTSNDVLSVPVVTEAAEADESAKMP